MFYSWADDDLVLNIRVQPRSSEDKFAEVSDNRIKLRITLRLFSGFSDRERPSIKCIET